MRSNGSSEHHQNNNLKVVITFGNFIGKDNSFLDINKKEQVLEFLNRMSNLISIVQVIGTRIIEINS